MDPSALARYIDHTALKATTARADIVRLCEEAVEHGFASVCINSHWVGLCVDQLRELNGTDVEICTVVGFPLGASTTATKVFETTHAIKLGAEEVDMVINVGALLAGDYDTVREDIEQVKAACAGLTLKVILETCYLSDDQIVRACRLATEAGADFVKTSTGFGTAGATLEHVRLMKGASGPSVKVKASGGIRDRETAIAMIEAGADRLGCSAGVAIVTN